MSKTIFIGGRLESKEKGNVVTGANAILDDTKGKKQNVINKETDDELLRLEQSKQDNLTFDNTPTEDSTNPVTSGGVYTAEKALSDAIEAILLLIPSAATALNKLVDTNTMNSSISTATATFRGTYNAVSDLGLTYQATHAQIEAALDALGLTADNNDYAFVQVPVSDQSQDIAKTERYKNNGTNWQYEYDLNTSGFTAAQWAAINSGITVALVTKLTDLPTAAALQLALNAKQDVLTFDTEPTALSQNPVTSGGIFTAIQAIATALSDYSTTTDGRLGVLEGLIPSEAASNNKLTDKAYVDGLIRAITELIPAEATTSNQLADKAYVLASILAATPAFKGQFTTLAELQAVASPKDGDLGIVRTKDSDGMDVFTVYQYLNNAWGVFYSLSYHPQTKPATTGTTGDYPYNGMGRVELAKNMVNTGTELAPVYENQLTQDMFYKGAVGSRVPNTNIIFVIKYDFTLGENITVPENCVLEFDGGSISASGSNNTMTLNNTTFKGENIVFTNIALSGTLTNKTIKLSWVGGSISRMLGIDPTDHVITFDVDTTADATINYSNKNNIVFDGCNKEINVGADSILFALEGEYSNIEIKNFKFKGTTTSRFYSPNSGWNVIHDNIHIHHNNINGCSLGISLNSDLAGETINSSIHDNIVKVTYPGQDIGCYGIHTANANYCAIYNNYITGANRHAMYISWGHDIDISNNFFYRCGLSGDKVRGVLFITRKSQNINITNNIFKECMNVHLMIQHGENDNNRRTAGDLINVNVIGNIFENLYEDENSFCAYHILVGYRVETNNDYIEKNINITNNIIKHLPGMICIGIQGGENVLVDSNIIIYDNTYEDLSEYNNDMIFEIASRDDDNYIKSVTITNNTFDLCYGGADCFYTEHLNPHFDELTIKNNTYLNEAVYHKNRNLSLEQFPNAIDLIPTKGISSARPSLGIYNVGWRYFDTTLDKPIWWNGTAWVDATGAPV